MIMQMQQAVMRQIFANRCNSFKRECKAKTTFHAVKKCGGLFNPRHVSHGEDTIPARFVWSYQPQLNRTYNIVPVKERNCNKYNMLPTYI